MLEAMNKATSKAASNGSGETPAQTGSRHMGRRGLIAGSSISGLLLLAAVTGVAKAHEPDGELIRMCNEAVGTPESAAAWKAICARCGVITSRRRNAATS